MDELACYDQARLDQKQKDEFLKIIAELKLPMDQVTSDIKLSKLDNAPYQDLLLDSLRIQISSPNNIMDQIKSYMSSQIAKNKDIRNLVVVLCDNKVIGKSVLDDLRSSADKTKIKYM